METIRTFVAVPVISEVQQRAQALIERLRGAEAEVKWVDQEKLHLTLKFLGDVPNTEVNDVCQAVQRAAARHTPFYIKFEGAGAFPEPSRARTVWIGVTEGNQPLDALQQSVEEELEPLGFPPENRRFHPHLTLGRLRRGGPERNRLAQLIEESQTFLAGHVPVDEVRVYASFLDKTGPMHDILGRAPLAVE